jgi:dienelactone hydrolase
MPADHAPPVPTFDIGGLRIHVYGLRELPPNTEAATVCFFSHGRMGSTAQLHGVISRFHAMAQSQMDAPLLVVAFDHRNHGTRLVGAFGHVDCKSAQARIERTRNLGWREHSSKSSKGAQDLTNPTHALDMYSIQSKSPSIKSRSDDRTVGSAHDISFLIDFLPAALFPTDQTRITTWACAGISLGGHSTWLAGAKDARLTTLIPIIGSPSLLDLMSNRARQHSLDFNAPLMPESLKALAKSQDPVHQDLSVWQGKRILALCGATDQLVPHLEGGTDAFVQRLREAGVDATLDVQEATGHVCSPAMLSKAAAFLARCCRTRGPSDAFGSGL